MLCTRMMKSPGRKSKSRGAGRLGPGRRRRGHGGGKVAMLARRAAASLSSGQVTVAAGGTAPWRAESS